MEQKVMHADEAYGSDDGMPDILDPPAIRAAMPILRHLDPDGRLLSSMIADPVPLGVYKTVDHLMDHLLRLIRWKIVSVKFIEDELEGDDHRLSLTDLGRATLRLNGG